MDKEFKRMTDFLVGMCWFWHGRRTVPPGAKQGLRVLHPCRTSVVNGSR
jgi:hypothetical protein